MRKTVITVAIATKIARTVWLPRARYASSGPYADEETPPVPRRRRTPPGNPPPGGGGREPGRAGIIPGPAAPPFRLYLGDGRSETDFRFPLFHLPGRHVLPERVLRHGRRPREVRRRRPGPPVSEVLRAAGLQLRQPEGGGG